MAFQRDHWVGPRHEARAWLCLCTDRLEDEAEALAPEIDGATAEVGCAISRLEREIDLLREYRTRLVADVVTGKLDVREAAAWLPNEGLLRDFASSHETHSMENGSFKRFVADMAYAITSRQQSGV